jgi:hypothetical protein
MLSLYHKEQKKTVKNTNFTRKCGKQAEMGVEQKLE